jgi:uncharacterized Tic20 family protein
MDNLPSDKSVRNVAMWGTLSNLILLAVGILPKLVSFPSIEPFILSIFPIFIWQKYRRKNCFIDKILTKAINFTLSICLYFFITSIVSMISLVVGYAHSYQGSPPDPNLDSTIKSIIYNICDIGFYAGLGICILLIFVHACTIAFGSFQAAKGNIYKYPLSIHFFKLLQK